MGDNRGYITNTDERGSVNISEEVVAVIAASAAVEVEGVHGLFASHGKDISQMLGKKSLSKGVKITEENDAVAVDVFIMADMGYPVADIGAEVQKAVRSAVEAAAGMSVAAVNVHICGVALKSR